MAQYSDALTARLTKKKSKQKGGGTKKHGRNAAKCKHYRDYRSHTNKLTKLRAHLRAHPTDTCAVTALILLGGLAQE